MNHHLMSQTQPMKGHDISSESTPAGGTGAAVRMLCHTHIPLSLQSAWSIIHETQSVPHSLAITKCVTAHFVTVIIGHVSIGNADRAVISMLPLQADCQVAAVPPARLSLVDCPDWQHMLCRLWLEGIRRRATYAARPNIHTQPDKTVQLPCSENSHNPQRRGLCKCAPMLKHAKQAQDACSCWQPTAWHSLQAAFGGGTTAAAHRLGTNTRMQVNALEKQPLVQWCHYKHKPAVFSDTGSCTIPSP
jgi:hypothetical protein